ncbi:MAG: hypothetical protein WD810_03180 [Solirubrobacterales bacterium]
MKSMSRGKLGLSGVAVLALLLVVIPPAGAAEGVTREEFVKQAEPICKTNVLANKRIFKGAKAEVKAGKLKLASTHFFRAATAFGRTIRQLAAVPRPPEDEAKLDRWFEVLRDEKRLIEKIGRALAVGDKHRAESYSVDLNRNSNLANNTVLGFGFAYCRIDPSRFG